MAGGIEIIQEKCLLPVKVKNDTATRWLSNKVEELHILWPNSPLLCIQPGEALPPKTSTRMIPRVVLVIVKNQESPKAHYREKAWTDCGIPCSGILCSTQNGQARATRVSVGTLTNTMLRKKSNMVPFIEDLKTSPKPCKWCMDIYIYF